MNQFVTFRLLFHPMVNIFATCLACLIFFKLTLGPEKNQVIPGNDQNTSLTNQKTAESKLEVTS